jgi:hypothetical protein
VPNIPLARVGRFVGFTLLGLGLIAIAAVLVVLLFQAWSATEHVSAAAAQAQSGTAGKSTAVVEQQIYLLGIPFTVTTETSLMLLVVVAGALGSYVHAATSFASYVGNGSFKFSWFWWYLLRIPIGVGLALLFYFALRAGLVNATGTGFEVGPFGVAALGGLAGLFSKQAVDKLQEVFDTVFRVQRGYGDSARADKLVKPMIDHLDPPTVTHGQDALVHVYGIGFSPDAKVTVDGATHATTVYVSPTELVVNIPAGDVAAAGERRVTVTAMPIRATSDPATLTVQ